LDWTHAGAFGRIKAYETEFLSREYIEGLIGRSLSEITQLLSGTIYKEDIEMFYSLYKNPEMLEIAVNRRLAVRNSIALFAVPPSISTFLKTYFLKWDVENIKAVMASKILGYSIHQTETLLLSFRDIPVGVFGGLLSPDDYKVMIGLGSVEAIVEYLARFPIGTFLMQYLDTYRKSRDTSDLFWAMDLYLSGKTMESLKFYTGREEIVRRYFKMDIDEKNIMLILKAVDLNVSWERIDHHIIPGGFLDPAEIENLFRSGSVNEIVNRLKSLYDLEEALSVYLESGLLYNFEISMKKKRYSLINSMRAMAASLPSLFSFVLRSEIERENLRSVIAAASNGLKENRLRELLTVEVLE